MLMRLILFLSMISPSTSTTEFCYICDRFPSITALNSIAYKNEFTRKPMDDFLCSDLTLPNPSIKPTAKSAIKRAAAIDQVQDSSIIKEQMRCIAIDGSVRDFFLAGMWLWKLFLPEEAQKLTDFSVRGYAYLDDSSGDVNAFCPSGGGQEDAGQEKAKEHMISKGFNEGMAFNMIELKISCCSGDNCNKPRASSLTKPSSFLLKLCYFIIFNINLSF